ncbi:MAG: Eco57I restriction-modification methylase domain-containing protein [Capnocytophaga felis]|nr:Eco57I restriction-modification methylase domain-containing protein [Capnocytophaga felis]
MKNIIENFSINRIKDFFWNKVPDFTPNSEDFSDILNENEKFSDLEKLGEVKLSDNKDLLFFACKSEQNLSERSAKKVQYEIAKRLMQQEMKDSAIAIFYDEKGDFRFSFIRRNYGDDQKYTSWKRYTYFVSKNQTNRTFLERIQSADFSSLDKIQEAFSVEKLTKDFYNDLFKWFSWTLTDKVGITFPNDTRTHTDDKEKLEEKIIRLITRVLFVWFIKHKGLVPNELFEAEKLEKVLKNFDKNSSESGNYYNAILQNLFFATLNKPINERGFATLKSSRDIKTLYRYAEMFSISETEILELFKTIPFLNGGLFECLDKELKTDGVKYHLDGFSRNANKFANGNFSHRAFIPNCVFFGNDDNEGLISLLNRYNFTIEENSSTETQVALDPELLGNVFENLLGAFNEETKETARKQSGSFYTPREVVDFMVNESLKSYLGKDISAEEKKFVEILFKEEDLNNDEKKLLENKELCKTISDRLHKIKILDPACGSGAFPMGILSRMVELLDKLDVENQKSHHDLKTDLIKNCIFGIDIQSIAVQISKLRFFISLIVEQDAMDFSKENYGVHTLPNLETKFVAANSLIGINKEEDKYLLDLKDKNLQKLQTELSNVRAKHFEAKSKNEKQKLRDEDERIRAKMVSYLITPNQEKIVIYQQQIAKLEKERINYEKENWVDDTFNSVVQASLFEEINKPVTIFQIDTNKKEREKIDKQIKALKKEIIVEQEKGKKDEFQNTMQKLAQWNPYDQNSTSDFFDMEWMFGIEDGFDIVIGNPPYIQLQKEGGKLAKLYEDQKFETFQRTGDIYALFYEKGWQILKPKGILAYITSNKWMRAGYGESLRKFFVKKTNPLQLIDFGGIKVFESATVDTNILLFAKENNTFSTLACVVKEKELKKMSDYFRQNATISRFKDENSWVILSEIEQRIKEKIEAIGTPLKEWNINIYRGILTGFNEAFIINGEKRKELIEADPKSAEIIRPFILFYYVLVLLK